MLNAYFANSDISSNILFADSASIPFLTQPGTITFPFSSTWPFINTSLSFAITSSFFFPIALRTKSALPNEYPAKSLTICITCSWYTIHPYVTFNIGSKLGCVYSLCPGFCFPLIYLGIWSIGPGLYNETPAIKSSKQSGFNSFIKFVMPCDSNWNIPDVFPSCHNLYTLGSDISLSNSTSIPLFCFTRFIVSCITVNVLKPKKSIFRSPNSSSVVIIYCVEICPSLTYNGT